MHARISGWVGVESRTHDDVGIHRTQHFEQRLARRHRHEHANRPTECLGERGCRKCRIAARGDRQWWTRRCLTPRRSTGPLSGHDVQQFAEQMSRLVRARDVVRLVLHPHTTRRREAECVRQFVRSPVRRRAEPNAGDESNLGVELFDQRDACGIVETVRCGEGVPREIATERCEGIGMLDRTQWGDRSVDVQHVMTVHLLRVRAAPRQRGVDRHLRSARRAPQTKARCGERRHG